MPPIGDLVGLSPWRRHATKWKDGCGDLACSTANRVVLSRGTYPCDVLFVGEAPGEAEDTIGAPFVGPAGRLLDGMIEQAAAGRDMKMAFTNLVGCIPRSADGHKSHEPCHQQMASCSARLVEFIGIAQPRLLVRVGKLAQTYLCSPHRHATKLPNAPAIVDIDHPAFILRSNVSAKGLLIQRVVAVLSNAFSNL